MPTRYGVTYRTGGTERYQWHRANISTASREEAAAMAASIERQGYRALVVNDRLSRAIGLPETYDGTSNPARYAAE